MKLARAELKEPSNAILDFGHTVQSSGMLEISNGKKVFFYVQKKKVLGNIQKKARVSLLLE